MSEEEKNKLKILIHNKDVFYYEDVFNDIIRPLVGKLLNLYEQDKEKIKELESDKEIKDKMIKLMSEHLTTPVHDKKWVIEYFENLAKESGEIDEY